MQSCTHQFLAISVPHTQPHMRAPTTKYICTNAHHMSTRTLTHSPTHSHYARHFFVAGHKNFGVLGLSAMHNCFHACSLPRSVCGCLCVGTCVCMWYLCVGICVWVLVCMWYLCVGTCVYVVFVCVGRAMCVGGLRVSVCGCRDWQTIFWA